MGVAWRSDDALTVAVTTAASASLVGSCGVVFLFIYFKWWKSSTHHFLLLNISIADILTSVMDIIGPASFGNHFLCQFQAFITQSFGQACQCWCCLVGINLLLQIKYFYRDSQCRKLLKYWHALIWTWALLSGTVPLIAIGGYEELEAWCWIGKDYPEYRMWMWYYPLFAILTVNFIVISIIIKTMFREMKKLSHSHGDKQAIKQRYRFVVFQTVLFILAGFIVWTPGTINRLWQYSTSDNSSPYEVVFLHTLFTPSQGLFNFLIYVFPLQAKSCCFFICNIGRTNNSNDAPDEDDLADLTHLGRAKQEPMIEMSVFSINAYSVFNNETERSMFISMTKQ